MTRNIYHKPNLAAYPLQATGGDFESAWYRRIYFLDPDDAVEEHLAKALNYGISF